ncbi:hypothetical protein JCM10207_006882 [Rhodosporidiobolus poonsookiae]
MPRNASTVQKKTKAKAPVKKTTTRKGKSSTYNAYMNAKVSALKKEDPKLEHKEAFQKAMDAWKAEQKGKSAPA